MLTVRSSTLLKLIQLFPIITCVLVISASVRADPIILSGSATLIGNTPPFTGAPVNLVAQNFSANLISVNGNFGLSVCGSTLGPCTGASLSWLTTGGDLSGSFTLNGMTFPASLIGNLEVTSVNFVIPPEFFNATAINVIAPFSFSGLVGGGTAELPVGVSLTGGGTVHVFLVNRTIGGSTGFFLDRADYIFGPQVPGLTIQEVPEPMTLLLFASGLTGTAMRLRHRSKRLEKK